MNKFEMLKSNLERFNLQLLTSKNDFHSVKQKVIVSDGTYTAVVRADNYIRNTTKKVPL